jgi:hypothetical protein
MNYRATISRRGILKAAGLFGGAALLMGGRMEQALAQGAVHDPQSELDSWNVKFGNPPLLGRVHGANWIKIFREPKANAGVLRNAFFGDVMPILSSIHAEPYDVKTASDVWFETNEGWVHSAYVVPCHESFNEPVEVLGTGFWGEVSVPLTWQHKFPVLNTLIYDYAHYRGFYHQVYKIIDMAQDEAGLVWYRVEDELELNRRGWVLAHHIRRLTDADFAPISPEVTDKRIAITLDDQMLTCYEGGSPVFKTRIASGTSYQDDSGKLQDFSTNIGKYNVKRKRPGRRMKGGTPATPTEYDVNGVPWVTYFTDTGGAIHGAYWHNNFGRPRSHGCINVSPDAANWIFRWTQPFVKDTDVYDPYRWTEKGEASTVIEVA